MANFDRNRSQSLDVVNLRLNTDRGYRQDLMDINKVDQNLEVHDTS
jgi:hypothetical protein